MIRGAGVESRRVELTAFVFCEAATSPVSGGPALPARQATRAQSAWDHRLREPEHLSRAAARFDVMEATWYADCARQALDHFAARRED